MPETLSKFPKVARSGRTPKYPYEDWFKAAESPNGVKLVEGDDFDCTPTTARHNIYRHARDNGLSERLETVMLKDSKDNDVGLAIRINRTTSTSTENK